MFIILTAAMVAQGVDTGKFIKLYTLNYCAVNCSSKINPKNKLFQNKPQKQNTLPGI